MNETNWDLELKNISREFDGLPAAPVISLDNARKAAEKHARELRAARNAAIGTWARAALVAAVAVALYYWPYARECGVGLFAFMGAGASVAAGALWVMALSWKWRLARANAAGMLLVIASLAILASQVLPRVGYAKVDPAHPKVWLCK
jgi:hypothetical protein